MQIRNMRKEASESLEGRLSEAWEALLFPVGMWLIFRLVSAVSGFAASGAAQLDLFGLFGATASGWTIFKLALRLLDFFCVSAAVFSMAAWYCGNGEGSALRRLRGVGLAKWFALCAVSRLVRFLPLLASAYCFYSACGIFTAALNVYTGNGAYFVLSVCLALLGICMLLYRLYITLLFILCPFILMRNPDIGAFAAMRMSAVAMKGGFGISARFLLCAARYPLRSAPVLVMMLSSYSESCNKCNRNDTI